MPSTPNLYRPPCAAPGCLRAGPDAVTAAVEPAEGWGGVQVTTGRGPGGMPLALHLTANAARALAAALAEAAEWIAERMPDSCPSCSEPAAAGEVCTDCAFAEVHARRDLMRRPVGGAR